MNHYLTGTTIKELRDKKNLTQAMLAEKIGVSDKTISKWETMRGLPDISLIEPLASGLGVSVAELLAGEYITNHNVAGNMLKSKLYVCPICGNVIHSMGEASVSCCGVSLPAIEAEACDSDHEILIKKIEDEYLITMEHAMEKQHYISFFAYVTTDKFEIIKLYPEEAASKRFRIRSHGNIYAYCNRHGLIQKRV